MSIVNSPPTTPIGTVDKRGNLQPPPEGWRNFFVGIFNVCNAVTMSGPTAERPATLLWIGRQYWDTTLQIPVYYAGAGVWKDATGAPV